MKYIMLSLLTLAVGCKDTNNLVIHNPEPSQPSDSVVNLEGLYMLPDGGSIELVRLENNSYLIYGTQRVVSTNADATLALYPSLPASGLLITNNELFGLYTVAYSATNNLKRSSDNVLIVGSRLTQYRINFGSNGKLNISIKVFGTNNLDVEASRLIVEE